VLGALRPRNYRLFFGGQVISMVGTWMQAFYGQAVMGVGPLGATQAGALASLLGAPAAMAIGAAIAGLVIVCVRVFWPSVFTLEPGELVA
jgi:hypothetical protein